MARPGFGQNDDPPDPSVGNENAARPYIGVYFECCGAYTRVYRHPDGKYYYGRCPRCMRTVRVRVGPDGTNARLFRAH